MTSGWQARLELGFAHRQGRTVLARRQHRGPLQVQRPFYPEADGTCHAYILHPPGGVVGGDRLEIEVALEHGARALLTTPAAGKFYRSAGAVAQQRQRLRVADAAVLEWLPQETIAFDGTRAQTRTRVELAETATFIGWEVLCLGRPAAREDFTKGAFRQDLEVWRDGRPLYLEHGRYQGGSTLLQAPWGLNGQPVVGTLVCTGGESNLAQIVRSAVTETAPDELFATSHLDDALLCRYLGPSAQRAFFKLIQAWRALRPAVLNKKAVAPRVWQI